MTKKKSEKLGKAVKAESMPNLNALFSTSMLGDAIKSKRTTRGWKQDDLAEQASLTKKTIIKMEKGDASVTFAHLIKVMDILGLSFKVLDLAARDEINTVDSAGMMHGGLQNKVSAEDDGWYE
ncbi:helix-turn-helix domain-containing protein [Vibrio harveyi]|uniref:Transcriptional regulator n=1 Tax=Vibrio vulnificus TaxID=672 RepID=A0A2S3R1F0_VIBVL|nr:MULTISPECIES: helix-turn-helix domain-containing protein [Vibrio]MCZ2801979.1 helix-turn-helix domain-containing protein [Vibrio alginolyticus]POB46936.1 transcriptional regulator [Vibrio vulnificus]